MEKVFIGIDPGSLGGIAVFKGPEIKTYNMPDTYPDIYILLSDIKEGHKGMDLQVILEDVGHGIPGQSSKATAVFARHNGHLEMALYALGIRTVKVTPQKWQKHFSNSLGKSSQYDKTAWKNKLKGLAQQMYPTEKVTLKTADAILLATYGADIMGVTAEPPKKKAPAKKIIQDTTPGLFD